MSLIQVSERLEPVLGIPVIGINAALLWYALRENGISDPLEGAGRLLREF
jgi:maleate isomerase